MIPLLAELGVGADEIAWAYTFTTGVPIRDLERIHDGLVEGRGPLAYLRERFPPRLVLKPVSDIPGDDLLDVDGNDLLLAPAIVQELARFALPLIGADADDLLPEAVDQVVDFTSLDYFLQGTFETPFFLSTALGHFDPDELSGRRRLEPGDVEGVPWFLGVPRPTARNGFAEPPYPVAIFQHPSSTSRLVAAAVTSVFADYGLAVIGMDAAANGPILPDATDDLPDFLEEPIERIPLIDALTVTGRTPRIDVNGDGRIRSGEGTFVGDLPVVRDIFRQSVIDLAQLTRVIRSLGTDADGNGRLDPEEGDFDGDGVLDVGGPDRPIVLSANSLGTFMAGPFLALTREIDRGAFNAPGAGSADILVRLDLPPTVDQLFVETYGPAVVGTLAETGSGIEVGLIEDLGDLERSERLGPFEVPAGTRVRLVNETELDTEPREVRVEEDGTFLVTIPADVGDRLRLAWRARDGGAAGLPDLTFTATRHGFGVPRNGPELRSFVTLLQNAAGPGTRSTSHPAGRSTRSRGGRPRRCSCSRTPTTSPSRPRWRSPWGGRPAHRARAHGRHHRLGAGHGDDPPGGNRDGPTRSPLPAGQEDRYPTIDYDLTRTLPFEDRIPDPASCSTTRATTSTSSPRRAGRAVPSGPGSPWPPRPRWRSS